MVSQSQDGGPGRRDQPHRARKLCEALHCENDQTKTSSFSHDWHVQPDCQRSVAGVRLSGPLWIKEYTAKAVCPRTCCAAFCGMLTDSRNLRAFTETIEISGACQWDIFPSCSRACSTKFERSAQNAARSAHGVLVGNFAQEGNSPSPCNGLFALEGLSFSTDFLRRSSARRIASRTLDGLMRLPRLRSDSGFRYGLCYRPVEQLPLRSLLLAGLCFCPTAKLHRDHCSLVQLFKNTKVR